MGWREVPYSNMISEAWRRQLEYSGGMLLCVMLLASRRRCLRREKLEIPTYLQKLDRSNSVEGKEYREDRLGNMEEKQNTKKLLYTFKPTYNRGQGYC